MEERSDPLPPLTKNRAMTTTVKLQNFENATSGQHAFALSTVGRLEGMVNNPVFLDRLGKVTYTRNIYFPNDRYQIEATNEDLVRVITTGAEWKADPTGHHPDYQIDLFVRLEQMPDGILGGVDHPDRTIKTSTQFFQEWYGNNNWVALAGHWFHEWLHTAGFQHAFRGPDEEPDYGDAVYVVGNLLVNVEVERWQQKAYAEEVGRGVLSMSTDYFDAYSIPRECRG